MPEANSYSREKERLEEIVMQTRSKDVPLEKSLDLYDEALAIGTRCVEQLEKTDFTSEELETLSEHPEVAFDGSVVENPAQAGMDAANAGDAGVIGVGADVEAAGIAGVAVAGADVADIDADDDDAAATRL